MMTHFQRNYWPTISWHEAPPQEQGIDAGILQGLDPYLTKIQTRPSLNTVLVIRHGYIVFERYANGYDQQSYQLLNSMTKSVISTLVGVALQQGYLHHLDQRWEEFLPEYFTASTDPRKKQMTLRHFLSMTSGLNPDFLAYPGRCGDQSTDWMRFAVEKPVLAHPEQMFMYSSLGSHLLSEICFIAVYFPGH